MNKYYNDLNIRIKSLRILLGLVLLTSLSSAQNLKHFSLSNSQDDSLALVVVKNTDLGNYTSVNKSLLYWKSQIKSSSDSANLERQIWPKLFEAIFNVAQFNDLGKKSKLNKAKGLLKELERELEKLEDTSDLSLEMKFAQALIEIQGGFVEQSLGNGMSGGSMLRSGANSMNDLEVAESKGFYFLYAYYLNQATSWIPFVSDDSKRYLEGLEKLSKNSPYFASLFANAAGWMRFDKKEYDKALALIKPFSTGVNQRVFHQMGADLNRKAGRLDLAKSIYKESRAKYKKAGAENCIRDLSAWANLALIDVLQNKQSSAVEEMAKINEILKKRDLELPPSLINELEAIDLL